MGWMFDSEGRFLAAPINDRANSVPLSPGCSAPVFCVAAGAAKSRAIRAAMRGGLVNCLITNEATAETILK